MTGRVTIVAQDKQQDDRLGNSAHKGSVTIATVEITHRPQTNVVTIANQYRVAVNHSNGRDNTSAANKCTDTIADKCTVEDVFTTELVTDVFYIFNSTVVD